MPERKFHAQKTKAEASDIMKMFHVKTKQLRNLTLHSPQIS